MVRFNHAAAWMIAVMLCAPVVAQQNVEDRKAILDAQIELARKQADLNEVLRRLAGGSSFGLPSVVSISRVGDRHIARLQMPNGTPEYVREGESIRQGVTVAMISSKQVIIAIVNGKKKISIPLDFVAVTNPMQMQQQQAAVPPELLPTAPDVTLPVTTVPRVPTTAPAAPASPQPVKPADATATAPKGK